MKQVPTVSVSIRCDVPTFTKVEALANKARKSVSAYVRELLAALPEVPK